MTTKQAIQDVAMIARNGIDRVIALERDKAILQAEVSRLRELSDEMFATMVAALSLAPQACVRLRSVSSARWVMDYEKHEGKKP